LLSEDQPIRETDIRQIHKLVLTGVSNEAGQYRSAPVEISGSDYSPTKPESINAEMDDFGRWLSIVSNPKKSELGSLKGLISASVAHTWLVTIHPFIDGNGRVARLLLNLVLMRYAFPIAIIAKEDRIRYYDALEQSQTSDLTPFILLISECINESLEEYEAAADEMDTHSQWIANLVNKYSESHGVQIENQYEVWKNAMELFKSYLQGLVDGFNDELGTNNPKPLYFKDYGNLEFEKYSALRVGESTKRTWFMSVHFRQIDNSFVRRLFLFGHASYQMKGRQCWVSLYIAKDQPSGSQHFERLVNINTTPLEEIVEIGYAIKKERFVIRPKNGRPRMTNIDDFCMKLLNDMIIPAKGATS